MHPGPGRAVAGGCGAYRAFGPELAHLRLVAFRLPNPSELPAQAESRPQAITMVFLFRSFIHLKWTAYIDFKKKLMLDMFSRKNKACIVSYFTERRMKRK